MKFVLLTVQFKDVQKSLTQCPTSLLDGSQFETVSKEGYPCGVQREAFFN